MLFLMAQRKRVPTPFLTPLAGVALVAVLGSAALDAQSPAESGLARDLADRILALVPSWTRVSLSRVDDATESIERDLASLLTTRGVQIVAADANPSARVSVGCGANLRERTCVADVRRGDARQTVAVVRALTGADTGPSVAIEAIPLFRQRDAILDVAALDDRLFVLDPTALTLYRRAADGWQRVESRPIVAPTVWPRDIRGRVRIADGIEAFLPGILCRAPLSFTSLSCAEQRESWPLAIDNSGLAGLRNTFQTPEGAPFFSAAALDADAEARAAMVDATGNVVLVDDARTPLATIGTADDVASLTASCGGVYLLASGGQGGKATDILRVWHVARRLAVGAGTAVPMAGTVTALWAADGARVATAVVHDSAADRYEAFQIRLACDR